MASHAASARPLKTFVIWAPDYKDPSAITRRLAVRDIHLKHAHELAKQGINRLGAAFFSTDATTADSNKIVGSLLIFRAESLEAARKLVEQDINYNAGVWDKHRLQILPVDVATLQPPIAPNGV